MTDPVAQSFALSLGVSALVTVLCRRMRIPALLPLLAVGVALGVSGVGLVQGASLGPALRGFITVAIGLLIFEGALHLNREELARAPRAVRGLLTVGVAVTWAGSAGAAYYLLGLSLPVSVLLGAVLIVTGPTVVQPILRMLRVTPRLHTALGAEAVLIDPLGVLAAVTTLEIIRQYAERGFELRLAGEGLWHFSMPLIGGALIGVVSGAIGYVLLRRASRLDRPDAHLLNLIAIGVCMTCVGAGEAFASEAGLAAVTICGVIMARARVLGATELRAFKELLSIILVGSLFVLLASRFDVSRLGQLTWREFAFVGVLLFVIRPVAVALSTLRSNLTARERVFCATFAPRGIVALSVATVAAGELRTMLSGEQAAEMPVRAAALAGDADRLELLMFTVIAGTVLLGSTISPLLVWALGVRQKQGEAVLIVGGHPLGIDLALWLQRHKVPCRVIDSNEDRVLAAHAQGVEARLGDATDVRWMDDLGAAADTGWVIAWTGNHDVDQIAARWALERLGPGHVAVWSSKPARGTLEATDISAGTPITAALDRRGDGELELEATGEVRNLQWPLGRVHAGRFAIVRPGESMPEPRAGEVFVGVRPTQKETLQT